MYFANEREVKSFVNTAMVVTVISMGFGGDKYVFAVDSGKEGIEIRIWKLVKPVLNT